MTAATMMTATIGIQIQTGREPPPPGGSATERGSMVTR